ncbi:MAG: hypothetical protein LUC83_02775 [Clostridiales bacterium]|nr:hypothetical protein [Clostridiales bacterium]
MEQKKNRVLYGRAKPGDDILVTKWIGLEGTVRIARQKKQELLRRFPLFMIEEAVGFSCLLQVLAEVKLAAKQSTPRLELAAGGVFGGLWEFAEYAGVGLEISLKKIPIRQETIEICNFYDINPYLLLSGGSLLLAAKDGHGLADQLRAAGIFAAVVGKAAAGNDRVVLNGDGRRFLEPPRWDEVDKVSG